MRIGAIVQARMSSKRFPGKVMFRVEGKPLIEYLFERMEHGDQREVVLATSDTPSDDSIAGYCRTRGVTCFRGALDDVASRFLSVIEQNAFDAFIRINGDSPLLDMALVTAAVDRFRCGQFDVVTNIQTRTFPKGQSVEVVSAAAFRTACAELKSHEEREHLTRHFYQNPSRFRIDNFTSGRDYSRLQLSVDSAEDMARFTGILALMDRPHWCYGWADTVSLAQQLEAGTQV